MEIKAKQIGGIIAKQISDNMPNTFAIEYGETSVTITYDGHTSYFQNILSRAKDLHLCF